ncbi:MAG: transketolase [Symbiobacteriia bacterium]
MSDQYQDLKEKARVLRRHVLEMTAGAKSGHPSSSLSAVELVTALYFKTMRLDPTNPNWPDRDRFLLSKGHASPILYAAMAERGYLTVAELNTFRRLNSRLQGHPTRHKLPGVEIASGSLGQGLSQGVGIALGGKLDKKDYRVYVMLGDGELQEGQNWEAAMAGPFYKLDNLCAIVDYNGLESDGPVEELMGISPLDEKFRAFNWHVISIDGHDFPQIFRALDEAAATFGRPTMILAHTVKGKGVSFMENALGWHGVPPKPDELAQALAELG